MKTLSKKEWVAVGVAVIFVAYTLFGGNITSLFQKQISSQNLSAVNNSNIGGLAINDAAPGQGQEAKMGDTVSIHYILSLSDGTVIQNSKDFGQPFTFTVGSGQVIAGMDEGVLGMKTGGVRTITIPPQLGYGTKQVGPIPPNSTLIFTIELVDVVPTQ